MSVHHQVYKRMYFYDDLFMKLDFLSLERKDINENKISCFWQKKTSSFQSRHPCIWRNRLTRKKNTLQYNFKLLSGMAAKG